MSTNFNTCFIDSNGRDVSEEFVEKSYLLDVYPNLIGPAKAPSLWTWGSSILLGNNSAINSSSPVQTVSGGTNWKQVSVGSIVSAIKTDGTLWVWGAGVLGSHPGLGDNTATNKSSPVQTISGGTNWKQTSTRASHTTAIKTDGTLWQWGAGDSGAIAVGFTLNACYSSPVQTISGGTNWKQASSGSSTTAAIKTDGTLWTWGSNAGGSLGNNTRIDASSPVQTISGGTNWKQVSVGLNHIGAVKADGTLWTWGSNAGGSLGINSTGTGANISRSSPVQTVSGGTNWKQISAGECSTAAIKTDGTLWIWGWNTTGQLGINSTSSRSSPVQTVSGGTNWKCVEMGWLAATAIKTDGTLWTWGCNAAGVLGDGSLNRQSSPVQTISGGTNWKQASMLLAGSAGTGAVAAIREEGDW